MSVAALVASVVGLASAAALAVWAVAALQTARRPRVVCLMYHRVAPRAVWESLRDKERIFTVPEDAFDAQIGWLRDHGFRFVSAGNLARFARGEDELADRSVLVTIDDGCASAHARMLPILRRHGARAILFVTTDPASAVFGDAGERRVSNEEMRELAASGVEIGSHAVSHRPLTAMDEDGIRRELADSRRELERVLGLPVVHFGVPANWYDERVLRIAREVGYESVYCSRPDTVRRGSGALGIPRVNIEGHLRGAAFARAVSPAGIAQRRLVMALRGLPKHIFGPRVWPALRREVFQRVGGHRLSPSRMATVVAAALALGLALATVWLLARG